MAAAVENDIDDFIRNQKVKLQQERQYLNESERVEGGGRKQWDRNGEPAIPLTEQNENVEPVSNGLPLDNSKADARREQLRRERQQEYQAFKEQNAPKFSPKQRPHTPQDVGLGLGGEYEKRKKKIDEEHKQNFLEYFHEQQSKKEQQGRTSEATSDESPRKEIDYGQWEKSFQEEKKREYNEFIHKPKHRKTPTPPQPGMRFGEFEDFKKKVEKQRKEEYREELEKQQRDQAYEHRKARTPPEESGGLKFGEFEDYRKRVEQQRKDTYRQELEKQQREQAYLHRKARTPPQEGLRFGEFEDFKRRIDQQRKDDYRKDLQKQRLEQAYHHNKAPTPPQRGMKFGEFEEFRKRVDQKRKDEYREDLEKQQREQAYLRAVNKAQGSSVRDLVRGKPPSPVSYQDRERRRRERRRRDDRDKKIEEQRVHQFQKMLHLNRVDSDLLSQGKASEEDFKSDEMHKTLHRYKTEQDRSRHADYEEMLRLKKQLDFEKLLKENEKKDERKEVKQERERPSQGDEEREVPHRPEERPVRLPAEYIPPLNLDMSVTKRDYSPPRAEDYTAREQPYAPPKIPGREVELSEAEKRRQKFAEERQRDYKSYLQKLPETNRSFEEPKEEKGLNVGNYNEIRNKLQEERKQEYNEYLNKRKGDFSNRTWRGVNEREIGLPLENDKKHRKQMEEQRNKEYNEMLKQRKKGYENRTWKEVNEREVGLPLQNDPNQRKLLEIQRNRDYNEMLQQRRNLFLNRTWHDVSEKESGLPLQNDRDRRKLMAIQRNSEYNQLLLKRQEQIRNKRILPGDYRGYLADETYDDQKNSFLNRRAQYYSQIMEKRDQYNRARDDYERNRPPSPQLNGLPPRPPPSQPAPTTNQGGGLFSNLGKHDDERQKLNEERRKDYQQLLAEHSESLASVFQSLNSLTQREDPLDILDKRGPNTQDGPSSKRPPPAPQAERDVRTRGNAGPDAQNYVSQINTLQPHNSAEIYKVEPVSTPSSQTSYTPNWLSPLKTGELDIKPFSLRKQKARNEEYNEFLKQKQEKERHRFDDKKPRHGRDGRPSSEPNTQRKGDEGIFATLPGLHYNGSAQQRKLRERNQEYNEFLKNNPKARGKQGGPKSGWQTPTYDEVLDRKRQEEAQYRRDDPVGLRPYASEGAINTLGTDDDRYRRLDQELDDKKVRFHDQRTQQSILEDDNWLSDPRNQEYRNLRSPEGPRHQSQPPPSRFREPDPTQPQDNMAKSSYYATLPVGHVDRESAKRRRKEKYKEELQLQMREREAATRRERVEDLKVNASGFLDPEQTVHRQKGLGDPNITPRNRNIRSPEVKPYHTKIISSPRGGFGGDYDGGGVYAPRERGRPREREYRGGGGGGFGGGGGLEPGILDRGFEGILTENRRSLGNNPPPGLAYQPSFADPSLPTRTYVTGGGSSGLNQAYSSIDEAYHYYGMKNPLDPDPAIGGIVPPLAFDRDDYGGRRSPRVQFDDTARARDRSRERISPYQFPSDEEIRSRSRNDKLSYKEELERQVQEKRLQKQREKEEKERYDRKLEEEIRNYNPFGRGGGGAPLKDTQGNVLADLRQFRGGQSTYRGSSRSPPPRESPRFRPPGSPKDDLLNPPPPQTDASGDPTYARGGHGIFGNPRTDEEKTQADRYKDDLKRQIEEKKRREQQDRERQRMEDEKENRRLEEQRQRIQQEFEEEQRKKRQKEEEAQKRNDEMRREAETRKRDQDRRKREEDEQKQREKREQEERERYERQQRQRDVTSPPVPAVKNKMATTDGEPSDLNSTVITDRDDTDYRDPPHHAVTSEDVHRKSPPIPALRKTEEQPPPPTERRPPPEPVARANSSDVLKELASMRKQLQSERRRVENALENQKNEPDVFDPRMVQRPPPKEIDVFERAKMGAPTVPVRTADNANPRNLQEFNELKYKNDTESRRAFRNMFPDAPVTNSALESQQDAMLRHQEDTLRTIRERSNAAPPIGARQGTVSPRSLLQSNSAFIDVDGLNHFPDDFEDLPRRNESARYRRRERITVSPRPESQPLNPMTIGSVTSLDVDRIQRKNDARLRRLHQMNADEVSVGDPDDILDRFMAKQRYNRPPSGQTLQDDTWLRPGSKAI